MILRDEIFFVAHQGHVPKVTSKKQALTGYLAFDKFDALVD